MKLDTIVLGAALVLPSVAAVPMPKHQFCRTLVRPDCGKAYVCVPIAAGCTTTTDCLGVCRPAKKYSAMNPVVHEKTPKKGKGKGVKKMGIIEDDKDGEDVVAQVEVGEDDLLRKKQGIKGKEIKIKVQAGLGKKTGPKGSCETVCEKRCGKSCEKQCEERCRGHDDDDHVVIPHQPKKHDDKTPTKGGHGEKEHKLPGTHDLPKIPKIPGKGPKGHEGKTHPKDGHGEKEDELPKILTEPKIPKIPGKYIGEKTGEVIGEKTGKKVGGNKSEKTTGGKHGDDDVTEHKGKHGKGNEGKQSDKHDEKTPGKKAPGEKTPGKQTPGEKAHDGKTPGEKTHDEKTDDKETEHSKGSSGKDHGDKMTGSKEHSEHGDKTPGDNDKHEDKQHLDVVIPKKPLALNDKKIVTHSRRSEE